MKQRILFFIVLLSGCITSMAQVFTDDFSDGEFIITPEWTGDLSFFTVNASQQLQLMGDCASGGEHYLVAEAATADTATWECFISLSFDPSGSNNTRWYLQSDNADLGGSLNGYYVKVGEDGTTDAVKLYRQNGESSTLLITGTSAAVAISPDVRIKVIRTSAGEWQLYADYTGGSTFVLEGSIVDVTDYAATHMGVWCDYTSTRCTGFVFDDFSVSPLFADTDAPFVTSVEVLSSMQLLLVWNETLDLSIAETESNYSVDGGVGNPINATVEADGKTVTLTFGADFPEATTLTLEMANIADLSGNSIDFISVPFSYYTVQLYDVVINEIMADPEPEVGLPTEEYIELFNNTSLPIDIGSWTLSDATDTSDAFPAFILEPGAYVVLCDDGNTSLFSSFGDALGIGGFPTLNNDGDLLAIYNVLGEIIHTVAYTSAWYNNAIKEDGGYSLEMIDAGNPCQGSDNWMASNDISGGTPAQGNSVMGANPDEQSPILTGAFPISGDSLLVQFNEAILAESLSVTGFNIEPGIGSPLNVWISATDPSAAYLFLGDDLEVGVLYTLYVNDVSDCSGNIVAAGSEALLGIPEPAVPGDVVINEILFNPYSDGFDFVEVYNRSQKLIDLSSLRLVEREVADTAVVDEFSLLSDQSRLLLPGAYFVITEDAINLADNYNTPYPFIYEESTDMPNFPDDEGIVQLEDLNFQVIDRLQYSDEWHYPLLEDVNGVSLERLNYDIDDASESNWHSAAENAGYATPGKQNSTFSSFAGSNALFSLESEVFSPDGDAYHDLLIMYYSLPASGFTANIQVYDMRGRQQVVIANNLLLSAEGVLTWDGSLENNTPAPMGIYFIFIELFQLDGTVEQHKLKCTLARKA